MKKKYCSLHGVWTVIVAFRYVGPTTFSRWPLANWATPAEWITRVVYLPQIGETTTAERDDLHSKSLFLVKNKGQWNAKSGPKAAYGNFAMRKKISGRLDSK